MTLPAGLRAAIALHCGEPHYGRCPDTPPGPPTLLPLTGPKCGMSFGRTLRYLRCRGLPEGDLWAKGFLCLCDWGPGSVPGGLLRASVGDRAPPRQPSNAKDLMLTCAVYTAVLRWIYRWSSTFKCARPPLAPAQPQAIVPAPSAPFGAGGLPSRLQLQVRGGETLCTAAVRVRLEWEGDAVLRAAPGAPGHRWQAIP